jgi:hypothetical protein
MKNTYPTLLVLVLFLSSCQRKLLIPDAPSSRGSFNFIEAVEKHEDDVNVHTKLKGVIVFLHSVNSENAIISGGDICEALTHFNEGFQNKNEDIYDIFSRIDMTYNEDGKMYMVTKNKKHIDIDKMRIRNGSSFIRANSDNNMIRYDVNDGITVGWKFLQFDLNYILIDTKKGDITFNYGKNKSGTKNITELLN